MRHIAALLLLYSSSLAAQSNRMEIALERNQANAWKTVDPALVLSSGDRIRFRFKPNFSGYLYVMIQSTSGNYERLFPRQDTGGQNRVEAGKEYLIPATQGHFRVTGPAGQDIIYWVISPTEMGAKPYTPLPPPPKPGAAPPNMTPRCDDTLFRARGECIDNTAGPQTASADNLPPNLAKIPSLTARDLYFIREDERAVVSSPAPLKGPVVYEYRLAHR